MLFAVLRAARPAAKASRSIQRLPSKISQRSIHSTPRALSGAPIPQIFGSGAKPGEVPTDENQATGLERLQVLAELEGTDAFDVNPLDSSRIGTLESPIRVPSLDVERIVGCTGSPADSHNLLWFNIHKDKVSRCTECGSAYTVDFQGEEHHDHH